MRWTCQSVRKLAEQLQQQGHPVSYQTVAELLHAMDYSLQANQKTLEGSWHADRDQQFACINRKAQPDRMRVHDFEIPAIGEGGSLRCL